MKMIRFAVLPFFGVLVFSTIPFCAGATWDAAANFNAPNNRQARSVFSYGTGGNPGAFVPMSHMTLNCFGTPTYCEDNGGVQPTLSAVTWNGTGLTQAYSTVSQPSNMVRMDPQATPGTIVRFTAPWSDTYSVSATVQAIDTSHNLTVGTMYTTGASNITTTVGAFGGVGSFSLQNVSLTAGQTIDFIVTAYSIDKTSNLSTGLEATITSATNGPLQILPQLAFGGGWSTAFYFTNSSDAPVSFTLNLIGDDGNPIGPPVLNISSVAVNLSARGTSIFQLPNESAQLAQGYASAALPPEVTGYAVFRQSVPGFNDQEAVVPFSAGTASTCTLLFDETNYVTGVAVVNLASISTAISVVARDTKGNTIGQATLPLAALAKTAVLLRNLPGMSGIAGALGSVDFTAPIGNLAVLGLRFNGLAFTSIPVSGH